MENKFNVRPDSFSEKKRPIILMIVFISIIEVFVLLWMETEGFTKDTDEIIFIIPVIIVGISLIIFLGMKVLKKHFESITIIIDEHKIIRREWLRKEKAIPIEEITLVAFKKKIVVQGSSVFKNIVIPSQMDDIEKIKLLLDEVSKPQEIENKQRLTDLDLNGKWEGTITLGREYKKHQGKELFYNLDLTQFKNEIKGISSDVSGFSVSPYPADINGEVGEFKITFTKQYQVWHGITYSGKMKFDTSKKGPETYFVGFLNGETNSFEGEWKIPMTIKFLKIIPLSVTTSGIWTMKKAIN